MRQQKKLRLMILIMLTGGIAFGIYSFIMVKILGRAYPDGSFLFHPCDRYMDFFNVNRMLANRRPYMEYNSTYPPFAFLVAWPLTKAADYLSYNYPALDVVNDVSAKWSFAAFFGFYSLLIAGVLFGFFYKNKKYFNRPVFLPAMVFILMFSAPYIYMLDRGNYLIVTIFFILLFALFYGRNENLSAMCLGIAVALKVYPVFLFILYFVEKKWKSMWIAGLMATALTVGSFFLMDGGVWQNGQRFVENLLVAGGGYANEASNTYFCVGLTSLLRLPFMLWNDAMLPEGFPITEVYLVTGTILTLWSMFLLWRERKVWKKILVLSCLMVFLTPNSYLYNLLYLLPGIVLFLLADGSERKWVDSVYVVMLGLLMIPKSYWYILPQHLLSISVPMDCFLLLGIILFYNLADRETRKREDVVILHEKNKLF